MCESTVLPWLFFCIDRAILLGLQNVIDFFKLLGGVP